MNLMSNFHVRGRTAFIAVLGLLLLVGCGRSSSAIPIEAVLAADAQSQIGATTVADVVGKLRAIDLTACPNDFREAYLAHIHAWELMLQVENELVQFNANFNSGTAYLEAFVRGFLLDFGMAGEAIAAENDLRAKQQQAAAEIGSTFRKVEQLAVKYGAFLPAKTSPAPAR
jgi:hypothetical protein